MTTVLAVIVGVLLAGGALCAILIRWAFSPEGERYGSHASLPHGRLLPWKDWDQEAMAPAPMQTGERVWTALAMPFFCVGLGLLYVLRGGRSIID